MPGVQMFFVWIATALAEPVIAVPVDVATMQATSACPDVPNGTLPGVVRTNVGVLFGQDDGTYVYGCPSRWGGDDLAQVASAPDRSVMVFLGAGGVYRSDDGGCSASAVALPQGVVGRQILFWRNDFYLLAAAEVGTGGSLLHLGDGSWIELATWTDFTPDGFAPGGAQVLWVAGARPEPTVHRIAFTGGLIDEVVTPLPEGGTGATSIEPRVADDDEAWFVLKRSTSQWTWHASSVPSADGLTHLVASLDPVGHFVSGPALLGQRWVSVIDGELRIAEQLDNAWQSTGTNVPWTCLRALGETVFACAVDELVIVNGVGKVGGKPDVTPVLAFPQVTPPTLACTDAACDADWARVAPELGFVDGADPAVCPDGRTQADLDTVACACTQGRADAGAGLALGVLGLGLLRRRQSPRPRTT